MTTKVKKKSPKKKSALYLSEKTLENALLNAIMRANSYQEQPEAEEEQKLAPIDFEKHCAAMQGALQDIMDKSRQYHMIILEETYAVICKKMNCVTIKTLNEDGSWMQPYEDKKERTFCVIKVLAWDDVREVPEVARFIELGAPYSEVYVPEDIEDKL